MMAARSPFTFSESPFVWRGGRGRLSFRRRRLANGFESNAQVYARKKPKKRRKREREREREREGGGRNETRVTRKRRLQREGTERDRNDHQRKIKKRSKDLKAEPVIARRPLVRAERLRAADIGVARPSRDG